VKTNETSTISKTSWSLWINLQGRLTGLRVLPQNCSCGVYRYRVSTIISWTNLYWKI